MLGDQIEVVRTRRHYYVVQCAEAAVQGAYLATVAIVAGLSASSAGHSAITAILITLAAVRFFEVLWEVVTGSFADLVGRRVAVALSFLSASIACLALGASHGTGALWIVGLNFWSMRSALLSGSIEAWLVDRLAFLGSRGDHSRIFATENLLANIAMIVGGLSGLAVVAVAGVDSRGANPYWPLWGPMLAISFASAIYSLAALREEYRAAPAFRLTDRSMFGPFVAESFGIMRANRPLLLLIIAYAFSYATWTLWNYSYLAVLFRWNHATNMSALEDSRIAGVALLVLAASRLAGSWLGRRFVLRGAFVPSTLAGCAAVNFTAILIMPLVVSRMTNASDWRWVSLLLGLYAIAKSSEIATKPLFMGRVNTLIEQDSHRSTLISFGNAAGSLLAVVFCVGWYVIDVSHRATSEQAIAASLQMSIVCFWATCALVALVVTLPVYFLLGKGARAKA